MIRKVIVLFFFILPLAALSSALPGCTKQGEEVKAPAPDFALQDLAGNSVKLSDYAGKVVMLEFWATWCPPCRASIPAIERLHQNYGPQGLVVLAVSFDQGGWDSVESFRKQYGITYRILKGTDEIAAKYKVRSIPTTVFVDREGVIRRRVIGLGSEVELEEDIRALL